MLKILLLQRYLGSFYFNMHILFSCLSMISVSFIAKIGAHALAFIAEVGIKQTFFYQ
jgi:hypothetical protein